MIKVEVKNEIQYFANRVEFGKWLIENNRVRDLRTFIIDEYTALEILELGYTMDDIKVHWWHTEVYDEMHGWFNMGLAEEIE